MLSGIFLFKFLYLPHFLNTKSSFVNKTIIYDEHFDPQNITNINQSVGNIKMEEFNENYIRVLVYGKKKSDTKVKLDTNKLTIVNTSDSSKHSSSNPINISINKNMNDIVVYIPYNYIPQITNIDSAVGDINLNKVNNLIINSGVGNIHI